MRVLDFRVYRQGLEKGGKFDRIVSGSKGYLHCAFEFSEEWDNCMKVAAFFDDEGHEYAVPIKDGECDVPDEVTDGRYFRVQVHGKRGSEYRLKTNLTTVRQEVV